MYGAFLSLAQIKEYLRLLTDNDLLRYDRQTHAFNSCDRTTGAAADNYAHTLYG